MENNSSIEKSLERIAASLERIAEASERTDRNISAVITKPNRWNNNFQSVRIAYGTNADGAQPDK